MNIHHIIGVLALLLVACTQSNKVPETSAPELVEGPTYELSQIDTLMWHHPDSALAVMMEFADSPKADSLDVFNGHYCQLLVSELLYKNDYGQSNRTELLQTVHYFDSLMQVPELVEGPSRYVNVFLSARAHYMNGVGYYERDSVVAACGEYLKALEMVETHFPGIETRHGTSLQPNHLPRFMALTYGRLGDLFSKQYMQEPAIICYKKCLIFNSIEPTSPNSTAKTWSLLTKQYYKINQLDSAKYCLDESLRLLYDTNNMIYRDLISLSAVVYFDENRGGEEPVNDLKRMAVQSPTEDEKLTRYNTIANIYYLTNQYDSALVYFTQVFENKGDAAMKGSAARFLRDIYQSRGDTLMATQYAVYQVENAVSQAESNAQVSQLNELFQQHLQWEQEKAEAERRLAEQEAARRRLVRGVVTAVVVLLVLGLGLWWWMAKRRKEHEAETQTWHEEKQQLQTQVDDVLQQLQTVDDALQQLQTQADDALQQARAMLPQRVADLYRAKVPNRLERIMDEFEAAYPQALEKLAAAYPELNETEQQIAVLNFLHFRAKEEADLLGLSDNTVNKYRSNLRKKTENAPFSLFLD